MSRKISTPVALAASAVALAILSAAAHASSSDFSLTLSDFTGSSSLSSGTFSFSDSIPFHIAGSVMQRDADNNGFGDSPLSITYDQSLSLSPDFILLNLYPNTTTAYSDSGPLTTAFDWSITMYDDFVNAFGVPTPTPVGSPLFGTAEFFSDYTILHINENLLWAAGLNSPFWGGYQLADISAIRLSQNQSGDFILESIPTPAPASAALFLLSFPLAHNRRRRS